MAGRIVEESGAEVWVNEYCYDWAVNTEAMWKQRMEMMEKHILGEIPAEGGANFKTKKLV